MKRRFVSFVLFGLLGALVVLSGFLQLRQGEESEECVAIRRDISAARALQRAEPSDVEALIQRRYAIEAASIRSGHRGTFHSFGWEEGRWQYRAYYGRFAEEGFDFLEREVAWTELSTLTYDDLMACIGPPDFYKATVIHAIDADYIGVELLFLKGGTRARFTLDHFQDIALDLPTTDVGQLIFYPTRDLRTLLLRTLSERGRSDEGYVRDVLRPYRPWTGDLRSLVVE